MSTPTGITLYQWSHCPFCRRVRRAFDDMGLDYETIEVGRDQQEVFDLLGKWQVPAIHDATTGVAMLESADIVDYARATYAAS